MNSVDQSDFPERQTGKTLAMKAALAARGHRPRLLPMMAMMMATTNAALGRAKNELEGFSATAQRLPRERVSILQRIETADTIEMLDKLRVGISYSLRAGGQNFTPEVKTVNGWAKAQWDAVVRLLSTAQRVEDVGYIFNYVRRWPKPAGVDDLLREAHDARAKLLPSPTERLRAQGIFIEGFTN